MWIWWVLGLALVIVVVALVVWRPLSILGREIHIERVRELFRLQREKLEAQFLREAQASGKPRGLRWLDCQFDSDVQFARDRSTRQIVALVGVTIQFEAIEGSDMEGLPAVGNLRNASAVFFFQRGHWLTAGKAVFNMNPGEAVERFKAQYEPIV
jgi:hypothetical protein